MAKVLEGPGMGLLRKWGISTPNYVVVTGQRFMANRVISGGAAGEKQALFSHNTDDFGFSHGKGLYCGTPLRGGFNF